MDSHRGLDDRPTFSLIGKLSALALLVLMFVGVPPVCAAELTATQTRPLRVATGVIEPFVVKRGCLLYTSRCV